MNGIGELWKWNGSNLKIEYLVVCGSEGEVMCSVVF